MERAVAELTGGGPTWSVILRVDEGVYSGVKRGNELRLLIDEQHFLCRPSPSGKALEEGREMLGTRVTP
jgi:hypothetical protein